MSVQPFSYKSKKASSTQLKPRATLIALKFRKDSFRPGWIPVLSEPQEALVASFLWSPLYERGSQAYGPQLPAAAVSIRLFQQSEGEMPLHQSLSGKVRD